MMRPARSIPQQWRLAAWRWHRGALSGLQGGGPGRPETPRRNLHGATVTGAAGGGGGGGRWRWNPGASQASWTWMAPMVGVAGLVGFGLGYKNGVEQGPAVTADDDALAPGRDETALPEFTWKEISRHKTPEDGVWVTHKGNVYDVTEFLESHPGGSKIMLAAGGPVEPFWDIYTIHKTEDVRQILQSMLIGRVKKSEAPARFDFPVPYANEPQRHPAMVVNSLTPFDAETPPEVLTDHFLTPNDVFYVRNHLPVPIIKEEHYKLNIELSPAKNVTLTLDDIKTKFPKTTIVATMQCAGNRRKDMGNHKKIYGANGGHTAISNAEWGGVLLRDILLELDWDETNPDVKHIQFEGYDKDISGEHYGASVPVEIAMRSEGDVLLAYEMNGEELPPDHGYPLRVVIPGVVGARSVKWLKSIKASKSESASFFQKKDYRTTPPSAEWNTFNFQDAHAIYSSPVQSAICSPGEGNTVDVTDDVITVRGYAFSGGGNGILRVDVSVDAGNTWFSADLLPAMKQSYYKTWAWTLWEAAVPVPASAQGALEIWCKATDTFHNAQPESVSGIWNLRGFLNNSWHKVSVNVK